MPAGVVADARKAAMEIAALRETLDRALLQRAPDPPSREVVELEDMVKKVAAAIDPAEKRLRT